MNVQFSFSDFEGEILSLMNVAPIQLHPNSWAFLRAFQILCKSLKIEPTVNKFMYFYQLKMGVKVGWASLNAYKFRIFFLLYSQSWKNFKSNFFQVHPNLASRDLKELFFKKDERTPKFPFYWRCFPFKFKTHSHQTLSAQEIKDIDITREWSCEMSCKFIMVIPNSCFPNCVLSSKYFYYVMLFIKSKEC